MVLAVWTETAQFEYFGVVPGVECAVVRSGTVTATGGCCRDVGGKGGSGSLQDLCDFDVSIRD